MVTGMVAKITEDLPKSEQEDIRIRYYTLKGEIPELHMCPGDLVVICNVLYDYSQLLKEAEPHQTSEYERMIYQMHRERCEKILKYLEHELKYSTEKAIIKCRKKNKKTDTGIGEDAMVLAIEGRRKQLQSKNEETE